MLSQETQDWLVARVSSSETMCRALDLSFGTSEQRVTVLDRLARALGLDVDRLGDAGYQLLDALRDPLQQAMAEGPGSWLDAEDGRHRRIVEGVVAEASLDVIVDSFHQFGWHRQRLDADRPAVGDVEGLVRDLMAQKLGQRIYGAMERWRKANVWPASFRRLRRA